MDALVLEDTVLLKPAGTQADRAARDAYLAQFQLD
jgi:hypothetical protein